jgi:hypothetical protein
MNSEVITGERLPALLCGPADFLRDCPLRQHIRALSFSGAALVCLFLAELIDSLPQFVILPLLVLVFNFKGGEVLGVDIVFCL